MTTTPTVIRDGIDPLVVTTKFDVDHEYDDTNITFVDITAKVYVAHGDNAIALDFGVFGNPADGYLEQEYEQEVAAIDSLMNHLLEARIYLMESYGQATSR